MKSRSLGGLVSVLCSLVLLSGCATSIQVSSQPSGMSGESNGIRSQLIINPAPLPGPLVYRPVKSCLYNETRTPFEQRAAVWRGSVSVKRVKDRYLVTVKSGPRTSTALIGARGKLYDFNLVDTDNTRATTSTYGAQANRQVAAMNSRGAPGAHVVNDFAVSFPDFAPNPQNPGDTAAVVLDENNNEWGAYTYRGLTQIGGAMAAVFDLTRVFESNPQYGPVLVGFDVVDLTNMMPVMTVLDAGFKFRTERISCSP